jgi:hypothetical protein
MAFQMPLEWLITYLIIVVETQKMKCFNCKKTIKIKITKNTYGQNARYIHEETGRSLCYPITVATPE